MKITGKKILDSKKGPTIEVEIKTDQGAFKASVPSGTSCGKHEAKPVEVGKAIRNIEKVIAPVLRNEQLNQKKIDKILIELDGTKDKSNLGANAILAVSMAVCRAGSGKLPLYSYLSRLSGFPISLPRPCFNMINGGAHAPNELDIQEFMIVPDRESFEENLKAGKQIYSCLKEFLKNKYGKLEIGDEAGFAPPLNSTEKTLDILRRVILEKVDIGLDCAASEFFKDKHYVFEGKKMDYKSMSDFYYSIIRKYNLLFLEDAFDEEDWKAWQDFKFDFLVGDDLLVTNIKRMKKANKLGACNAVIVKPNQIGTVTETLESVKLARKYNWRIIVAHRSGETIDDFIADLSVGIGAEFIKSGAPFKPERMSKYNRILQIEQEL